MAKNYNDLMKIAFEKINKEIQLELDYIIRQGESPLILGKDEENTINRVIYEIVAPTTNEINLLPGMEQLQSIDETQIVLKIDPLKAKVNKDNYGFSKSVALNVSSKNDRDDDILRKSFYGGEVTEEVQTPIVINKMNWVSESNRTQMISDQIEIFFNKVIDKKMKKITKDLSLEIGDKE